MLPSTACVLPRRASCYLSCLCWGTVFLSASLQHTQGVGQILEWPFNMWCGVVWCGVVWCGVVWCGVVWCDVVWCGVVWWDCGGTVHCDVCVGTILCCAVCCGCVMRGVWQIIRQDVVWCAARIHGYVHAMCVKVIVWCGWCGV